MKKLTNKKHILFCEEYLANGMNGTAAYKAVYKSVTKDRIAEASASRLLSSVKVKDYISKNIKKTTDKLEIKREDLIRGTLDIAECYDELKRLALKEKLTSPEEAKFARLSMIVKASDANKARDMIIRANGWNEPEKQIIDHKGIEAINISIRRNNKDEDGSRD